MSHDLLACIMVILMGACFVLISAAVLTWVISSTLLDWRRENRDRALAERAYWDRVLERNED